MLLCLVALCALATVFAGGAWATNWIDYAATVAPATDASGAYLIDTPQKLAWVAKQVNTEAANWSAGKTFKLAADIDLAGKDWTPIGDTVTLFAGTFDGGGHTISNMKIDRGDLPNVGLFGMINDAAATVRDLALRGVDVRSAYPPTETYKPAAGGLAGSIGASGGTVANVTVTGRVTATGGEARVGGLIGDVDQGTVAACASSCTVEAAEGTVTGAYAAGAGGLVGSNWGTIEASLATGAANATVVDSSTYPRAVAGGLSGYNSFGGSAKNSLAAGRTTAAAAAGSDFSGGVVGQHAGGTLTGNAYDGQGTGVPHGYSEGTNTVTGRGSTGATATATAALTGGTLPSALDDATAWVARPGYYPMPKALAEHANDNIKNAVALIAVPVVFANDTDTSANVTAAFTIPKKDAAGNEITWTFGSANVVSADSGETYAVGWTQATDDVTISAGTAEAGTKAFLLKLAGVTAYTVKFDAQGGSDVQPVGVMPGTKLAAPADPTRDGFVFDGWYKEEALTNAWDFAADTVTADITLYAKWTERTSDTLVSADKAAESLNADAEFKGRVEIAIAPASGVSPDALTAIGESGVANPRVIDTVSADAMTLEKFPGTRPVEVTQIAPSFGVKIPTTQGNVLPVSYTALYDALSADLPPNWAAMTDAEKAAHLTGDGKSATHFAYEYVPKSGDAAQAPVNLIGSGCDLSWGDAVTAGIVTFGASGDLTVRYLATAGTGDPFASGSWLVIPDKEPYPGYLTDPAWIVRTTGGDTPSGSSGVGCASGAGIFAPFALLAFAVLRRKK